MSDELRVLTLPLGQIGTNCFVVHRDGHDAAVVVDPGADAPRVLAMLESHELRCEAVFVTHCHWDHIGAVAEIAQATGAEVLVSEIEAQVLEHPEQFYAGMELVGWSAERMLAGGEQLHYAGIDFETLLLPGHSPGTIGFLTNDGAQPALFVGDVVFHDSIGRFDLPFADGPTLFQTLRDLFARLPGDTVIYPGHGPATTAGREREHNPFVRQLV